MSPCPNSIRASIFRQANRFRGRGERSGGNRNELSVTRAATPPQIISSLIQPVPPPWSSALDIDEDRVRKKARLIPPILLLSTPSTIRQGCEEKVAFHTGMFCSWIIIPWHVAMPSRPRGRHTGCCTGVLTGPRDALGIGFRAEGLVEPDYCHSGLSTI